MNKLPRPCDRKPLVESNHPRLSVQQQCILLCISKSSYYYKPVGESEQKVEVMRELKAVLKKGSIKTFAKQ